MLTATHASRMHGTLRLITIAVMLISQNPPTHEPPTFSTGAAQLPEFLLAWPELDALVCVSDELACGALYECQRRRIKVPEDIAVVGFGDSDVSRVCQPPLTTIAVPHRQIGIEAGRALLARLNGEERDSEAAIAASLCLRDSC